MHISSWEVAQLVEYGRLELACAVEEWMEQAMVSPGVQLLELTPQIAIESTKLRGQTYFAVSACEDPVKTLR